VAQRNLAAESAKRQRPGAKRDTPKVLRALAPADQKQFKGGTA